jgi:hypothetical protein
MQMVLAALAALALLPWVDVAAPGAAAALPTPRPSPAPDQPCGYVTFLPAGVPRFVNGTAYERIKVTVNFQDGHRETDELPYPWMYPNGEQTDPWSSTNLKRTDNFTVPLQMPPPSMDVNSFSPLIRYVLAHTSANGVTDLRECGSAKGDSPPGPAYDAAAEYAFTMARVPGWATIIDDSPADSPIKIVSAAAFAPRDPGALPVMARDCVTFWNRSLKTVASISFSFTHFDAAGELKLIQQFDRLGAFAPGVVVEGPRQPKPISFADPMALRNCRLFAWSWKAGANRVTITSVDFDDGTTWSPSPRTTSSPAPRR